MPVTYPSCTLGAPRKPAKLLSQWPKGHFCPHHLSHQTFDNCTLLCVPEEMAHTSLPLVLLAVRLFAPIHLPPEATGRGNEEGELI